MIRAFSNLIPAMLSSQRQCTGGYVIHNNEPVQRYICVVLCLEWELRFTLLVFFFFFPGLATNLNDLSKAVE